MIVFDIVLAALVVWAAYSPESLGTYIGRIIKAAREAST